MHHTYIYIYSRENESGYVNKTNGYEIKKIPLCSGLFKGGGFKLNLFWLFSTIGGKSKIYVCYDKNKPVHYSYVTEKCMKFPFLKKDEIHIGPCYTAESHRGRGIYPAVLNEIIKNYKDKTAILIIDDKNNSSIKGAEKAGFVRQDRRVEAHGPLRIYKKS